MNNINTYPLIDSHCHFDFPQFDGKRQQLWQQARAVGVEQLIIPAIGQANFARVQRLCQQQKHWHPAYALHPMFTHQREDLQSLSTFLEQDAIAVGECGLDYVSNSQDKKQQQYYFAAQLELAQHYQLPVIIHARKAVEEVLLALAQRANIQGVIHSFSGSLQQAERALSLGFKLGLGGPVTYPRAKRLRSLFQHLPLSAWLLETDAPDQPLHGYQGQINHPAQIHLLLETAAQLRSESRAELAAQFYQNSCQLFGLEPLQPQAPI